MIFVRCVPRFHSKMRPKATLCLYIHLQIDGSGGDLTLIPLTWRIWWACNNANRWQMGFNSVFKGLMKVKYVSSSGWGFYYYYYFWLCCIWRNIHLNCIQLCALKVTGTVMVRPGMQGKQVFLLFFCDYLLIGFWLQTVFKCDSRKTIIFAKKKKCFSF